MKAATGASSPVQQWRAALVAVVALAAVVICLMRFWGPDLHPAGWTTAVQTLPQTLSSAATCHESGQGGELCVIAAGDPLLAAGIGGGHELAFAVRVVGADQLSNDVRQWRSARPTVVADGAAFIAISLTWNIWYADTQSGLRLETGSLPSAAAARGFLLRSGLLR
ncbi:hypothetical protein ACFVUS_27025 [Nocardia sp. NPDC058058]|uniref:hypothetical protein n=1 Tax=Nocardia sp. NPDC058058 TaxID=3346317 RepID=UPI0036D763EF